MTNRFARLIAETAALNPDLMRDATRRLELRFLQQRSSAKYRGVEFRLTFEEWRDWWLATGHVDERGKLRGQWVMARPGDAGAYEVGNLECMRAEDNVRQQNELRAGEYEP
jgi:hypothetical protein